MNKKGIFWGVILILLAVYIIIGKLNLIPDLPIFTILATIILIYIICMGIKKMNFVKILIPSALLGNIYSKQLHIEAITPWPLLAACILIAIGLDMIFMNTKREHKNQIYIQECTMESSMNGASIKIENSFSGNNKYISSENLSLVDVDNAFGQCNVYFDNAVLADGRCVINVDSSFGETNLYFPHTWHVEVDRDCAFADVKVHGTGCMDADAPFVQVKADVSFGAVNIYFN